MTSEENENIVSTIFYYWIDCVAQFFFTILGVIMNLIIILIISSKKCEKKGDLCHSDQNCNVNIQNWVISDIDH